MKNSLIKQLNYFLNTNRIAVAGMECEDKNWIGQKHKLASDIMNYAQKEAIMFVYYTINNPITLKNKSTEEAYEMFLQSKLKQ